MNKVKLKGRIVDIYNGSNVSSVTLMIKTNNSYAFPTVKFTGYKNSEPRKFKRGDVVSIDGSYRAYAKKDLETGKRKFVQYIKGKQIEYINDDYSSMFGIESNPEDVCNLNEVVIEGRVEGHRISNKAISLLVRPTHDTVCVWIRVNTSEPYVIAENYPVGALLRADSVIKTYKNKNERKSVEFISVTSLAKVDDESNI